MATGQLESSGMATGQLESSGMATGQLESSGIATGQLESAGMATGFGKLCTKKQPQKFKKPSNIHKNATIL